MKWIVGLGNPGTQYRATRHNVGFMAIDLLADRWNIAVTQSKFKALIGEGTVQGEKVFLIKPMTYMNLSGEALRAFADFYKADIAQLIVIYDDLDTAVGRLRLRYQGSAGGHNGIKSIIQHLNTQRFDRIRVGISRPEQGRDIADYVLSPFVKEEVAQLPHTLTTVCEAVEYVLQHNFEQAMAKYNQSS